MSFRHWVHGINQHARTCDMIESMKTAQSELAQVPGSDPYEAKLRAWCQRMGVRHPDDPEPVELFIEPDSELDDTIDSEVQNDGVHVDLFDMAGWRERTLRGTQESVAAQLGVDRVTIARRETGALPITREAELALLALPKNKKRPRE